MGIKEQVYDCQNLGTNPANAESNDITLHSETKKRTDYIRSIFLTYGIEVSDIEITQGFSITLYEVFFGSNTIFPKVCSLADEITLKMERMRARIIAPMPGKSTIGIEIPNKEFKTIELEQLLYTKGFHETSMELPCAIGKTNTNKNLFVDLASAPHILIAGSTGSGKTTCLNSFILSLLYKKTAAELNFVLIDTKNGEFAIYDSMYNRYLTILPNFSQPVITNTSDAIHAIDSLCGLMNKRFSQLNKVGARNIKEYREDQNNEWNDTMPYVVVIIDEFGELMMTSKKIFEPNLVQLVEFGHIVGIHLVIATQAPSLITPRIKSSFHTIIALNMATGIDSKNVINRVDATKLAFHRDMLVCDERNIERVQGTYVGHTQIMEALNYINDELPSAFDEEDNNNHSEHEKTSFDPLFVDVAHTIVQNQIVSTNAIVRKYCIGYNRAGRLMDQLVETGVVINIKPYNHFELNIENEEQLNQLLKDLKLG